MNLEEEYKFYDEKLHDMIAGSMYDFRYYKGKVIKETVLKCMETEKKFFGVDNYRYREFYDKYINSKYPLSDNELYRLVSKPVGIGDPVLICYKKKS